VSFGAEASTDWNRVRVQETLGKRYVHHDLDIRDRDAILDIFRRYGDAVELVIHASAWPSDDWAARELFVNFDVNAVGTLNLLERVRLHAEEATFIFTSTNKVYGDRPNPLPLRELETRWEIEAGHAYWILGWTLEYDLRRILKEIRDANRERGGELLFAAAREPADAAGTPRSSLAVGVDQRVDERFVADEGSRASTPPSA
jgi:hypothetical protein